MPSSFDVEGHGRPRVAPADPAASNEFQVTSRPHGRLLFFAVVSFGLWVLSCAALLWVFLSYVPRQAASLAALSVELPLDVRFVIAASNWLVRLLPFAVLFVPAAGGLLVLAVIAVAMRGTWFALRALVAVFLVASLTQLLASGYAVATLRRVVP